MTKRLVILFLTIIILLGGSFSIVKAEGEYYSDKEIENVPDPLSRYTVKEEVNGFFQKARETLKPFNEKLRYWWKLYLRPKIAQWVENVKDRVKQGIEEEKQELQNKFWRGIKEFFK